MFLLSPQFITDTPSLVSPKNATAALLHHPVNIEEVRTDDQMIILSTEELDKNK